MKKLALFSVVALSASLACAQYKDVYYVGGTAEKEQLKPGSADFSGWVLEDGTTNYVPDETSNLFIDPGKFWSGYTQFTINASTTVHDLTFQNFTSDFHVITWGAGDESLNFNITGNLNAFNTSTTGGLRLFIPSTPATKGDHIIVNIGGSVNIGDGVTGSSLAFGHPRIDDGGPKSVTIGQNVNINKGSTWITSVGLDSDTASSMEPRLVINGVVNLDSGTEWRLNNRYNEGEPTAYVPLHAVIQLGGLQSGDSKDAVVRNDCQTVGGSTKMIFTNTGVSNFIGSFRNEWSSDRPSTVALIMNGSDTGEQIIRSVNAGEYFSGGITVNSGTLSVYNTGSAGDTVVNGGRLGVAGNEFDGSADSSGVLIVDKLTLNGGNLKFAADEFGSSGHIKLSGIEIGDGFEGVELHVDSSKAIGDDFDYDGLSIFAWDGTVIFSTEDLEKLSDTVTVFVNGYETVVSLANAYVDGNFLKIDVSGTVVPEPAAFAVIFGAIALALAAHRRRK